MARPAPEGPYDKLPFKWSAQLYSVRIDKMDKEHISSSFLSID